MHDCCIGTPGIMVALLNPRGIDLDVLRQVTTDADCDVANINSPVQVVISGSRSSVDVAVERLKKYGVAKKSVQLQVAGAFHSRLMEPAADGFKAAVENIKFNQPCAPIISNVTARPVSDPSTIKELLSKQISSPVLWSQSVLCARDAGVQSFTEIGPGKTLQGLAKDICGRAIDLRSVGSFEDITDLVRHLHSSGMTSEATSGATLL